MFYKFQFNVMLVFVAVLLDKTKSVDLMKKHELEVLREQGVVIRYLYAALPVADIRNPYGNEQRVFLDYIDSRVYRLCQFSARHRDDENEKYKETLDKQFHMSNRKKGDKLDPRFCFESSQGCSTIMCYDRDSGEPIFVVNGCSGDGMTCNTDEFAEPCHDQNGFIRCQVCHLWWHKAPNGFIDPNTVRRFCNFHLLEMPDKLVMPTMQRTTTTTIAPNFFPNSTQSTTTGAANFTPIGEWSDMPTVAAGAESESLLSITGTVLVSLIVLSVRLGVQF